MTTREQYLNSRKPCPKCGKLISPQAKTCQQCMGKIYAKRMKGKPRKEGRYRTPVGYVMVYQPSHPRARPNYVAEHILIWEQAKGKPLPKGWHIHHANGIKDDNRVENLLAMPSWKHALIIRRLSERIRELEAIVNHQTPP